MTEKFFRSELEKDVWVSTYCRVEGNSTTTRQRMMNATKLVLELREEFDKLLAFGDWNRAAGSIVGVLPAEGEGSVFRSDIERRIWISVFTRPYTEDMNKVLLGAKGRAKRAWELVLEFRQPTAESDGDWERAAREIAGKT